MTNRELFFRYLGLPSFQPLGLEIDRAEGIYLYDTAGKRYLDMVAGISVNNLGHRHPAVIKAIHDQLEKYLHLNVYGEFIQSPQVRLAQKLSSVLPKGLDSVYFVNSGSEAIEGAMKLAKRFTGRTEVIAFKNGYHGSTQGALSILGNEVLKNAFRPLIPDVTFIPFNDPQALEKITGRTACVVAETIQAEAGIILPDEGFLEQLRNACSNSETLLIIDDVQMGFGRTGKLFSYEHYGIRPDILVLAKAMGGGMPIGAFISSKEIMDTLANNPELGHITTFGGHPVCCAAALAALEVLTENDLILQADLKGKILEDALQGHPFIKEIHRKGLVLGIEINDEKKRKRLTEAALNNGIIIDWFLFHPATFRIAPPLTITEEECSLACDLLVRSLNES
ncbi:MAG: aspartate aminotransferase family protein [Bacteroidetes bacterium]|nr:aspartate aminotransferase family protein [Bacteroidota bacterium]